MLAELVAYAETLVEPGRASASIVQRKGANAGGNDSAWEQFIDEVGDVDLTLSSEVVRAERDSSGDEEVAASPPPDDIDLNYEIVGAVPAPESSKPFRCSRRITGFVALTDIQDPFTGPEPTLIGTAERFVYVSIEIAISNVRVVGIADREVSNCLKLNENAVSEEELVTEVASWQPKTLKLESNEFSHYCIVVEQVKIGFVHARLGQILHLLNGKRDARISMPKEVCVVKVKFFVKVAGVWSLAGVLNGRAHFV